jgi:hypothetical protein
VGHRRRPQSLLALHHDIRRSRQLALAHIALASKSYGHGRAATHQFSATATQRLVAFLTCIYKFRALSFVAIFGVSCIAAAVARSVPAIHFERERKFVLGMSYWNWGCLV